MRLQILDALLLFMSAATLANPTHMSPAAENPVGVYISTEPDWGNREKTGSFRMVWNQPGWCTDLMTNGEFAAYRYAVSSFGPEKWVKCTVYADPGCPSNAPEPGQSLRIVWPGYARLWELSRGGGKNWDNTIQSFKCEWGGPGGWPVADLEADREAETSGDE